MFGSSFHLQYGAVKRNDREKGGIVTLWRALEPSLSHAYARALSCSDAPGARFHANIHMYIPVRCVDHVPLPSRSHSHAPVHASACHQLFYVVQGQECVRRRCSYQHAHTRCGHPQSGQLPQHTHTHTHTLMHCAHARYTRCLVYDSGKLLFCFIFFLFLPFFSFSLLSNTEQGMARQGESRLRPSLCQLGGGAVPSGCVLDCR